MVVEFGLSSGLILCFEAYLFGGFGMSVCCGLLFGIVTLIC